MRTCDECRPYVEYMLAEHRRLHRLLRQARLAICGGPGQPLESDDVVRLLQYVRQQLAHHFAEEESGGCLKEAVSHCPNMSAQARRIEAEHPELLEEIDRLIAQARDMDQTVQDRVAVEVAFDDLCRLLHAHESAENAPLAQGFGTNLNGEREDELVMPT